MTKRRQPYEQARRTADRVLDRTAVQPVRAAFEREARAFLKSVSRAGGRGRADPAKVSAIGRAARRALGPAYAEVATTLAGGSRAATQEAVEATARFFAWMREGAPSRLDDPSEAARIASMHTDLMEAARRRSVAAVAVQTDRRIRQAVRNAALVEDGAVADVIDAVGETFDQQWWQIERVVRTETSENYNSAQAEAILNLELDYPGQIFKRWTELVDDATGQPLDKRVAPDSLVLHGQVARPGELFTMPADPRAPAKMIGSTWSHPPNRPNDRSILTPWMPTWGVPGWVYQGGAKMQLAVRRRR